MQNFQLSASENDLKLKNLKLTSSNGELETELNSVRIALHNELEARQRAVDEAAALRVSLDDYKEDNSQLRSKVESLEGELEKSRTSLSSFHNLFMQAKAQVDSFLNGPLDSFIIRAYESALMALYLKNVP